MNIYYEAAIDAEEEEALGAEDVSVIHHSRPQQRATPLESAKAAGRPTRSPGTTAIRTTRPCPRCSPPRRGPDSEECLAIKVASDASSSCSRSQLALRQLRS
jgi:hypothetical protein